VIFLILIYPKMTMRKPTINTAMRAIKGKRGEEKIEEPEEATFGAGETVVEGRVVWEGVFGEEVVDGNEVIGGEVVGVVKAGVVCGEVVEEVVPVIEAS
jgi:hypothetical protein